LSEEFYEMVFRTLATRKNNSLMYDSAGSSMPGGYKSMFVTASSLQTVAFDDFVFICSKIQV
jgi:hypothetical protein